MAEQVVVDERPGCPASKRTVRHEDGLHTCVLHAGHSEGEHRCPCGLGWTVRVTLAGFGGAPR